MNYQLLSNQTDNILRSGNNTNSIPTSAGGLTYKYENIIGGGSKKYYRKTFQKQRQTNRIRHNRSKNKTKTNNVFSNLLFKLKNYNILNQNKSQSNMGRINNNNRTNKRHRRSLHIKHRI
jgi:hypothetical protein